MFVTFNSTTQHQQQQQQKTQNHQHEHHHGSLNSIGETLAIDSEPILFTSRSIDKYIFRTSTKACLLLLLAQQQHQQQQQQKTQNHQHQHHHGSLSSIGETFAIDSEPNLFISRSIENYIFRTSTKACLLLLLTQQQHQQQRCCYLHGAVSCFDDNMHRGNHDVCLVRFVST
jgi:hypothetical protein